MISETDDINTFQAQYSETELETLVEHMLKTMDPNKDGYIEYSEYRNGI